MCDFLGADACCAVQRVPIAPAPDQGGSSGGGGSISAEPGVVVAFEPRGPGPCSVSQAPPPPQPPRAAAWRRFSAHKEPLSAPFAFVHRDCARLRSESLARAAGDALALRGGGAGGCQAYRLRQHIELIPPVAPTGSGGGGGFLRRRAAAQQWCLLLRPDEKGFQQELIKVLERAGEPSQLARRALLFLPIPDYHTGPDAPPRPAEWGPPPDRNGRCWFPKLEFAQARPTCAAFLRSHFLRRWCIPSARLLGAESCRGGVSAGCLRPHGRSLLRRSVGPGEGVRAARDAAGY